MREIHGRLVDPITCILTHIHTCTTCIHLRAQKFSVNDTASTNCFSCMSFVCTRQQPEEREKYMTCFEYNNNTHNFPVSVYFRVRARCVSRILEKKTKEKNNNKKKTNEKKTIETAVNLKQYPTVDACLLCIYIHRIHRTVNHIKM